MNSYTITLGILLTDLSIQGMFVEKKLVEHAEKQRTLKK